MIIVRSPLRITLGGGGTDLFSYYSKKEGFTISAAINKYVYVSINKRFYNNILLKYSEYEEIKSINEIKHPIIKAVLKNKNFLDTNIEINSIADIPSGTGLGSSSSFTAALIKAISFYRRENLTTDDLAKQSCMIEIEYLKEPIGKQDQYISSYGGVNCLTFHKDNTVTVKKLGMSDNKLEELEDNLLLFFTGISRNASDILVDQNINSLRNDLKMLDNLDYVKKLGLLSKKALEENNIEEFGLIMKEHWEYKKQRSKKTTSNLIDEIFSYGISNGASSGKVVGAGGGGFIMFLAKDKSKLRKAMLSKNISEVKFKFDYEGTKLINS